MFKKCPAVATTDHSTSGRWIAAKDLTDCAIQQNLCWDHVRDIMCMIGAKCLWLLDFDFARLGKTQQIPPKVYGSKDISLYFLSLAFIYVLSVKKQKHGWNYFLYCCHITSWCQFAHLHWKWEASAALCAFGCKERLLCNIGLNNSLRTYCQIANGISSRCLSGWNVLIQFNSSNLLRLGLSTAASRTVCQVL